MWDVVPLFLESNAFNIYDQFFETQKASNNVHCDRRRPVVRLLRDIWDTKAVDVFRRALRGTVYSWSVSALATCDA